MSDWSDEVEARLERLCALPANEVPCQDGIRAALGEIERLAYLHDLDHKLADGYLKRAEKAEAKLPKWEVWEREVRLEQQRMISERVVLEAKLAEAQGSIARLTKQIQKTDDRNNTLEDEAQQLREALRGKCDEYKMHDPGWCAFCDVARAALRGGGE